MASRGARGKKRAAPDTVIDYATLQDDDQYQKYLCPVCMDIQAKPLELPCGHSFCTECLTTHFETSGADARACPMCRAALPPGTEPAPVSDLAERKALQVRCACGREEPLLTARRHTDDCAALRGLGESGVKKAVATAKSTLGSAPAAPNRSTFTCPFCDQRHLCAVARPRTRRAPGARVRTQTPARHAGRALHI